MVGKARCSLLTNIRIIFYFRNDRKFGFGFVFGPEFLRKYYRNFSKIDTIFLPNISFLLSKNFKIAHKFELNGSSELRLFYCYEFHCLQLSKSRVTQDLSANSKGSRACINKYFEKVLTLHVFL